MSAHSLRGYHSTQLRGAGVPMEWIKRLQGKKLPSTDDPYYHPEQTGELLVCYVEAYPSLKVSQISTQQAMFQDELTEALEDPETRKAFLKWITELKSKSA